YEKGLQAVREIKQMFPEQQSLAPIALRWVLDHPQVSTVIPGASNPQQAIDNLQALKMPALNSEQHRQLSEVYASHIKPLVHHLW
ncbi:MAG: aldo/keto reductase, partial [Bacteroidota bacterium]